MTETTTETVTYAGRRTLTTGKLGHAYADAEGHLRYYTAPMTPAEVGSIITITRPADEPDKYYSRGVDGPKVTGYASDLDPATLTVWQVADRAAYQAKSDADARKRAAKRGDELGNHIEVLRRAAANLTGSERAAFARWVEDQIRGW